MTEGKSINRTGNFHRQVAFLIVDGTKVVQLEAPITNIGRKSDNHIVINHEHVSRHHAQIRRVKGQYILHDLNSTVGTSVNGARIEQATLSPGDVISIGGVPLIFGEGTPFQMNESLYATQDDRFDSGPTKNTDIQSADQYLDLFDAQDEG